MIRARSFPLFVGLFVAGLTGGLTTPAAAAPLNSFDNPGDTAGWTTDRYAPAGFVAGSTGGNRSGVLALSISAANGQNARTPGSYSSAFYNTQGMKADLASGTTSLFVDMFVPATGFGPVAPGDPANRYAGLWATAVDNTNGIANNSTITAYPIIEYASGGFRTYDVMTGAWNTVNGFNSPGQWYNVGFALNGSQVDYFINGQQVGSVANNGSLGLANVILQGYNTPGGVSYNAYFDNLSNTSSVPEPATLAVFGLMAAAGLGLRFRRRKGGTTA